MKCPYCHGEGEKVNAPEKSRLETEELASIVITGVVAEGVKKLKFLGGEPLVRKDLPEIIKRTRAASPNLDISIITSGVAPIGLLKSCFSAGLSRCNVSVHGWRPGDFLKRGGSMKLFEMRKAFIEFLLNTGRPTKMNYVYTGEDVEEDLSEFLKWGSDKPIVINVLDDLTRNDFNEETILNVLQKLYGAWTTQKTDCDPNSLDTVRLKWPDGLEVEVKNKHLGEIAPWRACNGCPKRNNCREGILALRLNPDGVLRICMDRPDLGIDLGHVLAISGVGGVKQAWSELLEREVA